MSESKNRNNNNHQHNRNSHHKKNKRPDLNGAELFKGRLDVTRSGMGFVIVEGREQDILIRPSDFNTALHGDTVRVKIRSGSAKSGRSQGEVVEVVERKQMEFLGHVELSQSFAFFIADKDKPMPDIYIPLSKLNGAVHNDKVVVRVVEWEKNKKPQGEVIQVLDPADDNDRAMKEILLENGFPLIFPEGVTEESERLPDLIAADEIQKRKDIRDILTFTIDPVDAKDFDDAISIRTLKNGHLEIGVHIADVSHYVEPETALDKEAYTRATSVYLPDRVNPMLPERISNELCSLRPHEDKLTFSTIFEMNAKGEVKEQWIGKTVIHSDHRFTYEDVQEIIEKKEGQYQEEIEILNDIAQRFRRQRFKKGAINFSSTEVRFKLDEKGKPIGILLKESKEAHQLVEEFMLLANRTVAESVGAVKVDKKPIPFPYRVHDTPDKEKLTPFIEFAKKYGHQFDTKTPEAIASSFNQMLLDAKGRPEQHVLEQLGIRTMAKAIYTTENIGHYGLGFEHYCHFTSPIRRYPDVMVHRILQECLTNKIEIDKQLEAKCRHSSERERAAMDSERAANKYKQVEYMQEFLGEEFEGVISGVTSFGFFVETVAHKCEGLVSINSLLEYDDFRHNEADYSLVGRRSGRQFRMGDKVTIKVVAANLTKRQLDYEWVIAASSRSKNILPQGDVLSEDSAPQQTSDSYQTDIPQPTSAPQHDGVPQEYGVPVENSASGHNHAARYNKSGQDDNAPAAAPERAATAFPRILPIRNKDGGRDDRPDDRREGKKEGKGKEGREKESRKEDKGKDGREKESRKEDKGKDGREKESRKEDRSHGGREKEDKAGRKKDKDKKNARDEKGKEGKVKEDKGKEDKAKEGKEDKVKKKGEKNKENREKERQENKEKRAKEGKKTDRGDKENREKERQGKKENFEKEGKKEDRGDKEKEKKHKKKKK